MWILILVVVLAVVIGLMLSQFEIRHEIHIQAPASEVWQAITAFHDFHHWNSQLEYLGGEVALKGKLQLRLSAQGAAPYTFKAVVSVMETEKSFAWLAITGLPRIFDGEHFFELQAKSDGTTFLVNREEYRGLLSPFIKRLPMMQSAPEGFRLMNEELKRYVEQRTDRAASNPTVNL
jgi:hypothetical protein